MRRVRVGQVWLGLAVCGLTASAARVVVARATIVMILICPPGWEALEP